jgi:hypothetical protein
MKWEYFENGRIGIVVGDDGVLSTHSHERPQAVIDYCVTKGEIKDILWRT